MRKLQISTLVSILWLSSFQTVFANNDQSLSFGIVPQRSALKLIRNWQPVLRQLSTHIGREVHFATAPNIEEFEKRCLKGDYDIAYMNPYHYIRFAKKPGYKVIVNQSGRKLTGIFVVKNNSDMTHLSDINGKSIQLPSPNAFAASLLTQSVLHKQNIKYFVTYVGSHDKVYQNVAHGIADVGGGISRTFNAQPKRLKAQLRILAHTQSYVPHAIVVHPRISDKLRQQIQDTLISLPHDNLSRLKFNPFQKATDSDYNEIRLLKLDSISKP